MAIRIGETPVPIPNTMVKAYAAEGTALETVWESRRPPDRKQLNEGKAKPKHEFSARSFANLSECEA